MSEPSRAKCGTLLMGIEPTPDREPAARPYPEIEKIAPHANIVHFKTYFGGGVWYTLDLDYRRIAKILRQANFKGYVSLEMEGNEPAATAVPKSLELMRQVLS